jgi:hypothetical protein
VVHHRRHGTLRRSGREKHRYLLLRNALMMAVKNYADTSLAALLPALLALSLRRLVESARIQRESFYFWSDEAFPETYQLPREAFLDAMTEAVALDDVLGRFAALARKREAVQALRAVSDDALLPRFGDPFRMVWKEPGSLRLEQDLAELAGLDRLFHAPWPSGGERAARLERHETELGLRIRHREGELELMNLRLDLAKQALEQYLEQIRQGPPLEPRRAVRRGLPLGAKLRRLAWLLRFYHRFEGLGGVLRRIAGHAARKLGLARRDEGV